MFDKFKPIAELEKKYGQLQKQKKAFDEANKYSLIEKINKLTYKKNIQEIEQISNQTDKILQDMDRGLSDLNSTITEEVLNLKEELSRLKISRSRNLHERNKLVNYNSAKVSPEQYVQLERFFPDINLKDIQEIEAFHESLRVALNDEINEEKNRHEIIVEELDKQISFIEFQIKERSNIQSLSKSVLLQLTKLQKRQEVLIKQNNIFEEYSLLRENLEDLYNRIQEVKQRQINEIQTKINIEMEKINDFIYGGQNKAPLLSVGKTNYTFITPDDSGTGTSYKSMIVYDLAIIRLTDLPVLVHDSYLLKQIQDQAIERILELYIKTNKQIFISIDKVNSLTQRTQEIVTEKECLHLHPSGGELFGKSWNRKKNK